MKISVDIECTPAEARTFLGLPDLEPVHAAVQNDLIEAFRRTVSGLDPEYLRKLWTGGFADPALWSQALWKVAGASAAKTPGKDG